MQFMRLATAAFLGLALTTSAAFAQKAADGAGTELDPRARASAEAMWKKMANKDGMITQKQFMDMVAQKWNEMDKSKKGMISMADAARIMMFLSGQTANP